MKASDRRAQGYDFNVDPMTDLSEEAQAEAEERQRRRANAYFQLFTTPMGDFVLNDLLTLFAGVTPSNDTNAIVVAEGQRRVVKYIEGEVKRGAYDERGGE